MDADALPSLYSTMTKGTVVRHLVTEGQRRAEKQLVQLEDGMETRLATGNIQEMHERAEALMAEWKSEGFKEAKRDIPIYESLPAVVALALRLGNTAIYQGYKTIPLRDWQGVTRAENGGAYEYALSGMSIIARPAVPAGVFEDTVAVIAFLQQVMAYRKSVGPELTFPLNNSALTFGA